MSAHPDPALFERLDFLAADARSDLLGHAANCVSCRERLLAKDPSRLFALLAVAPLPGEALARLGSGLDAELDRIAPPRRGPRRLRAAASLAASLILAGFLGLYMVLSPGPAPVLVAVPANSSAMLASERRVPADGVQLLSSPGEAQVLELTIGETQVTMIFDEALDI
jgi:hypothetical protein